jgi:hypothetical protein
MGLGCNDDQRKRHSGWCAILDFGIGATWATAPDPTGVVAVGTAALNPTVPTAMILIYVKKYNDKLYSEERYDEIIDTAWAQQHPMQALQELKKRGYIK